MSDTAIQATHDELLASTSIIESRCADPTTDPSSRAVLEGLATRQNSEIELLADRLARPDEAVVEQSVEQASNAPTDITAGL